MRRDKDVRCRVDLLRNPCPADCFKVVSRDPEGQIEHLGRRIGISGAFRNRVMNELQLPECSRALDLEI